MRETYSFIVPTNNCERSAIRAVTNFKSKCAFNTKRFLMCYEQYHISEKVIFGSQLLYKFRMILLKYLLWF